ncbi:oligosaccharide flippase family protein [Polynucleobacter sp. Ross1-W9]|uniref:oligosaccharide flippase family protein n=1 Tax=Polynucleobacter parvulilacunae TaxID=1855631 RepID=UPI001C0D53EB|nr:oligosaccharide flippase family protein [Polynucleobacter parvulilacunae]MBU3556851.1 oligosaccharide flippase family protein [Polynucleobacter parvulilacunae]
MAKRIRHRFFILLLLQGGQNIGSLLLLPILTRTLGPEGYGEVGFCIAFLGYFVLFTDWGFDLSSSRQVALNQKNLRKLSEVFWCTLGSRFFLGLIGALVLILLILIFPVLTKYALLLWLVYLVVIATMISTQFFYQGIEQLERYSFINLLIRLLSIPLIYMLVKRPSDTPLAVGIICGSLLAGALCNLFWLLLSQKLYWALPSFSDIAKKIHEAFPLAIVNLTGGLYSSSIVVVLGLLVSPLTLGYFVSAFNLIKAGQGLLIPLTQIMLPRLSKFLIEAPEQVVIALRKMFRIQSCITLLMMVVSILGAPILLPLILGEKFSHSVLVFQLLSPLFFLGALSGLLGQQALVAPGFHRIYSRIIFVCSFVGLIFIGIMSYFYSIIGASFAMVVTELLIALSLIWFLKKNNHEIYGILKVD